MIITGMAKKRQFKNSQKMARIEACRGDIMRLDTEAIVNAANTSLLGGGGVDGAIHRAAGPELLDECRKLNGCAVGDAKITKGYQLKAKFVIHTVGPVWRGGKNNEKELLSSCYRKSLELALKYNVASVAFPCISTGVYRFPKDEAARIAVDTVQSFLKTFPDGVEKVVFVCFSDSDFQLYEKLVLQ